MRVIFIVSALTALTGAVPLPVGDEPVADLIAIESAPYPTKTEQVRFETLKAKKATLLSCV